MLGRSSISQGAFPKFDYANATRIPKTGTFTASKNGAIIGTGILIGGNGRVLRVKINGVVDADWHTCSSDVEAPIFLLVSKGDVVNIQAIKTTDTAYIQGWFVPTK